MHGLSATLKGLVSGRSERREEQTSGRDRGPAGELITSLPCYVGIDCNWVWNGRWQDCTLEISGLHFTATDFDRFWRRETWYFSSKLAGYLLEINGILVTAYYQVTIVSSVFQVPISVHASCAFMRTLSGSANVKRTRQTDAPKLRFPTNVHMVSTLPLCSLI